MKFSPFIQRWYRELRSTARLIVSLESLILFCLLPLFLFPEGTRILALLVIPALWITRRFTTGRFIPTTPFDVAILVVLVTSGIGLLISFDTLLGVTKISGLLAGVALFYAIVAYSRSRSVWPAVAFIIASGVMIAILGLFTVSWQPPFDTWLRLIQLPGQVRFNMPGTVDGTINANELAGVLSWILPIMIASTIALARRHRLRYRFTAGLIGITMALPVFVLVATQSRGGLLAFASGLAVVLAFHLPVRWRLVVLIGFIVVLMSSFAYSSQKISGDIAGDFLGISGRVEIWARALLMIEDFPLTGTSYNGFRQVIHALYPLFSVAPQIDLGHAHNHLLQAALDLGLPGLVGYTGLWVISVWLLWSTQRSLVSRHARHHPYYSLVAGLSGSIAAGWVFGLFDAIALGARPGFIWWIVLGLIAAVNYTVEYSGEPLRVRRRRARQSNEPLSPNDYPAAQPGNLEPGNLPLLPVITSTTIDGVRHQGG